MEQYLIIDVGGTNIKSALMTKNGKIISKKQLSTAKNLDDFKEQILSLVAEVAEKIQGIAFSIPGKVDPHSAVVYHGGALPCKNLHYSSKKANNVDFFVYFYAFSYLKSLTIC